MMPYASPNADVGTASYAMHAAMVTSTCPHCRAITLGVPGKTLLGFQRFSCESCTRTFKYPLHRRYRIAYWLLLAVCAMALVAQRGQAQPSVFLWLVGAAVLGDLWLLWRRR